MTGFYYLVLPEATGLSLEQAASGGVSMTASKHGDNYGGDAGESGDGNTTASAMSPLLVNADS